MNTTESGWNVVVVEAFGIVVIGKVYHNRNEAVRKARDLNRNHPGWAKVVKSKIGN